MLSMGRRGALSGIDGGDIAALWKVAFGVSARTRTRVTSLP